MEPDQLHYAGWKIKGNSENDQKQQSFLFLKQSEENYFLFCYG